MRKPKPSSISSLSKRLREKRPDPSGTRLHQAIVDCGVLADIEWLSWSSAPRHVKDAHPVVPTLGESCVKVSTFSDVDARRLFILLAWWDQELRDWSKYLLIPHPLTQD